jgi:hypothetical protein
MEINYELTPEDFYQFGKENAPTQSTHKPLVTLYAITFLVFIFADVLYTLILSSLTDWNVGAVLAGIAFRIVICFVAILAVLGIFKLFVNRKAKEVLAAPQNGLFCEHRIILTENALVEVTDVNTSRYAWKAIGEIKEFESFVLINVLMSSTYIIPKRYFQDRKQITQFIETANQYRQNAENNFQLSHFIEYEKSLE